MTHGEVIILRLLKTRDLYGYELDRLIEENKMRHWADIGFSSIYHILNKMERDALLSSYHVKEEGSPRRRVYRVTELGAESLRREVIRLMTKPSLQHNDFAVGLICSDVLDEEEFRMNLNLYREHLRERLHFFKREIPSETARKSRVAMAIERFRRLIEAELRWLEEI